MNPMATAEGAPPAMLFCMQRPGGRATHALRDKSIPDPNLQVTLDALLTKRIVTGTAERLRPSPSVMRPALARLPNGMVSFDLPVVVPAVTVSPYWHPRLQAAPAHQWRRGRRRAVCAPPDAVRSTSGDDDAQAPRP